MAQGNSSNSSNRASGTGYSSRTPGASGTSGSSASSGGTSGGTQGSQDTVLGRLVIEQGLATTEEVREALKLQKKLVRAGAPGINEASDPGGSTLGEVLVTNEIITRKQLSRLRPMVDEQRSNQQIPGFQILGKLGAGAMATVYKAKQMSLDRMVAIKVLPRKHTNNPQFVERFYAEGRAAAKLNHPNIVGALDVGKSGEFHYFVMEYVEGKTVYDDIVEMTRYSEKEALNVIIQVAQALEHAHAAGFVHRDVKPKNIMIANDGAVKLADMGLARAVSDREAAEAEKGKAHGTPYYISPEQIRGVVDIDFRADIYCLGATFYHMVTGQVPFDGPNPSAVMHKHLKEDMIPPDELNPSLSNGISEIIEVAMAKDRNKRYNSTTEMLEDLNAVKAGEPPIHARQNFDFSSLSAVEEKSTSDATQTLQHVETQPSLVDQPVFWAAIAGWTVAILLTVGLIAALAS